MIYYSTFTRSFIDRQANTIPAYLKKYKTEKIVSRFTCIIMFANLLARSTVTSQFNTFSLFSSCLYKRCVQTTTKTESADTFGFRFCPWLKVVKSWFFPQFKIRKKQNSIFNESLACKFFATEIRSTGLPIRYGLL